MLNAFNCLIFYIAWFENFCFWNNNYNIDNNYNSDDDCDNHDDDYVDDAVLIVR